MPVPSTKPGDGIRFHSLTLPGLSAGGGIDCGGAQDPIFASERAMPSIWRLPSDSDSVLEIQ
jgi:hypothetical protein